MIAEAVEHSETFWDLFYSLPHWEFELMLEFLTAVIFGKLIWGFITKHIHKDDETLEARIIREVDKRFAELIQHMHEDSGINHERKEADE
jgi:hypothetical protein